MAKEISRAILSPEAGIDGRDAHLDFLRDAGRNGFFDGETSAAANFAGFGARAVSASQSLRIVRGDDSRALRKSSFRARTMDKRGWCIHFDSKPQDPSKRRGFTRHISRVRLEFVVCVASVRGGRSPSLFEQKQSLLRGDSDVLLLFAGNAFPHASPRQVAP